MGWVGRPFPRHMAKKRSASSRDAMRTCPASWTSQSGPHLRPPARQVPACTARRHRPQGSAPGAATPPAAGWRCRAAWRAGLPLRGLLPLRPAWHCGRCRLQRRRLLPFCRNLSHSMGLCSSSSSNPRCSCHLCMYSTCRRRCRCPHSRSLLGTRTAAAARLAAAAAAPLLPWPLALSHSEKRM